MRTLRTTVPPPKTSNVRGVRFYWGLPKDFTQVMARDHINALNTGWGEEITRVSAGRDQ